MYQFAKPYRPLWFALALLLEIIGHDALLPSGTHFMSSLAAPTGGSIQSTTEMAAGSFDLALPGIHAWSTPRHTTHVDGPAKNRNAIRTLGNDSPLGPSFAPLLDDAPVPPVEPARPGGDEPTESPAVRRAILQVYRI